MTREETKEMLINSYKEKNLPYSEDFINRRVDYLMRIDETIDKALEPLEEAMKSYLKTSKELNKTMLSLAERMSGER